jgi:hypothetical protein
MTWGGIGLHIRPTFSDMRQLRKELVELLLALVQFTTASVVDSEQGHNTVNDEKSVFVTNEELGNLVQELHLVLRVDGSSVGDVVLSYILLVWCSRHNARTLTGLWVNTESLSNLRNPLRPKCTFGICGTRSEETSSLGEQRTDVCHLAFGATHVFWQLRDDRHRMRHLCFSTTELAENFANAHGLEATAGVSTPPIIVDKACPYPPRMVSSCLLPVEILRTRFRC